MGWKTPIPLLHLNKLLISHISNQLSKYIAMYEQSLEDLYLQLSTDELVMLITSYRNDKEQMLSSGDVSGAERVQVTIQYLRNILNGK